MCVERPEILRVCAPRLMNTRTVSLFSMQITLTWGESIVIVHVCVADRLVLRLVRRPNVHARAADASFRRRNTGRTADATKPEALR